MGKTRRFHRAIGYLLIAATVSAAGADESARWRLAGWTHRIEATVSNVTQTHLPGADVAVATFYTGGIAAADARDIRVDAAGAGPVDHRILQVGPGDRLRVAFALRPDVDRYYIYLGNPGAATLAADKQLDIKRGVLMETYAYAGGKLDTLGDVLKTFRRATKLLGRDFRNNIFIGHNPFGAERRICSRFVGYLRIKTEDDYHLVISSQHASFLLIDGEVAIANGGRHRVQRDYSKSAVVRLSEGLHRIEMLHVVQGGHPIVVLTWRPNGRGRAVPIPPMAFAPVAQAACGPLQRRGRPVEADFRIMHAGESFAGGRYYQRYLFRERLTEGRTSGGTFIWDFGDGQTATGANAEHVFLTDGDRTVTLTAHVAAGRLVRNHRIKVGRDWDRVTQRKIEPATRHANLIRQYNPGAMSGLDAAAAAVLMDALGADEYLLALAEAFAERPAAAASVQRDIFSAAANVYRRAGRIEKALTLLTRAAANTGNPVAKALLGVLAGDVILADLRDGDRAMAAYQGVLDSYDTAIGVGPALQAHAGVGNVWRLRGDYDRALQAYQRAQMGSATHANTSTNTQNPIRRGNVAYEAEAHIQAGDYDRADDVLDRWEMALPTDRLTGYSTLLRVRLLGATEQWTGVINEAEDLVRVNPQSLYAPHLLGAAAGAHLKCGAAAEARECLERLIAEYPESALAAEAAARLTDAGP